MIDSTTMARQNRTEYSQRGSAAICALLFATMLGGLAFALLQTGFASTRWHDRADDSLYALEAAETGIARAEQEILSKTDPTGGGVGTLSGTYAGSRFTVTATPDASDPTIIRLNAVGQNGMSRRRLEVCVSQKPTSIWQFGAFGRDYIGTGGSGAMADSYDSRLGSYASQATNTDSKGYKYARSNVTVAGNAEVDLGSSTYVHGNAIAGPGHTVAFSSSAVVSGTVGSLTQPIDFPPTPYAEFAAADTTNNNGMWSATGGLSWKPASKELVVGGGNTLTLTGNTYFFSSLTLSGGSKLKINSTSGPVKIYITDQAVMGGGAIINMTGRPQNLQFYQYPYALPVGAKLGHNKTTLSGGSESAFVLYAPYSEVVIGGGGGIYGAVIAQDIDATGGSQIHYDESLKDFGAGSPKMTRLYWREVAQPKR